MGLGVSQGLKVPDRFNAVWSQTSISVWPAFTRADFVQSPDETCVVHQQFFGNHEVIYLHSARYSSIVRPFLSYSLCERSESYLRSS